LSHNYGQSYQTDSKSLAQSYQGRLEIIRHFNLVSENNDEGALDRIIGLRRCTSRCHVRFFCGPTQQGPQDQKPQQAADGYTDDSSDSLV